MIANAEGESVEKSDTHLAAAAENFCATLDEAENAESGRKERRVDLHEGGGWASTEKKQQKIYTRIRVWWSMTMLPPTL